MAKWATPLLTARPHLPSPKAACFPRQYVGLGTGAFPRQVVYLKQCVCVVLGAGQVCREVGIDSTIVPSLRARPSAPSCWLPEKIYHQPVTG